MNKKYIAISIVVFLALSAGFFRMRSHMIEALSLQSEADQEKDIEPEDTQQEPVRTPSEEDRSTEANDKAVPVTDAVAEEKTAVSQDVPITEVPKKDVKETPEETKTTKKLSGVQNKRVNFGFSVPSKPRTIDTIILHSSYDAVGTDPYSVSGVIAEWKDAGVAPHYLIDRNGTVYQLVKDENVAYHAGVSQVPDGRKNVNDFSIGIEIINTLDGKYTDDQYASVKKLIASMKGKYDIKYVLGHDDIAPGRKTDPWNFDWKKL